MGYLTWPLLVYDKKGAKASKYGKGRMLFRGLDNPRNWCFVNSAVQALSATKAFQPWLESICVENDDSLAVGNNLKFLIAELNRPSVEMSSEILSCANLLNALVFKHGWTRECKQQDVHEALILLFEAILSEMSSRSAEENHLNLKISSKASEKNNRIRTVLKSRVKVSLPFSMYAVSVMKCLSCKWTRKPSKIESARSISMYPAFAQTVPASCELQLDDLLRRHFEGELLTGVNCENCSKLGILIDSNRGRGNRLAILIGGGVLG